MTPGTSISRALSLLIGAASLSLFSIHSPADEQRPIIKAIDVQYVGAKTLSKERVLSRIGSKIGDRLSIRQVDDDIKKLLTSGEVANARILSDKAPGGIKLIVVVESRALYGGCAFEGNTVLSDRKLGRSIECKLSEPINASEIRKARADILTQYRKKGYPDTAITYTTTKPNQQGYSKVIFAIDEQNPGILRKVQFSGNASISATELKAAMSQKEKSVQNLFNGWGRTDATSVERDIEAIEQLYRNRGFFSARVIKIEKVPVDKKFNDLVITLQEGARQGVGGVAVTGMDSFSYEKEIAPYLKTQSGKPFSAEDIKHDTELIQEFYRSRGYIDVQVSPRIE